MKRTIADYFRLYRSAKSMARRLTAKEIEYVIRRRGAGEGAASVAASLPNEIESIPTW